MQINSDILQQIEDVIGPIERTLKTMLDHPNVKPESKDKVTTNLESLNAFKEKYRNVYGVLKGTPRQQ